MKRPLVAAAAVAALFLLAAGPAHDAETLLRQGHAAFEGGKNAAAADLFARALDRTPDPAPAAFALAAAKCRLAADGPPADRRNAAAEAERLFRSFVDAPGPRRAAALYGVANCLLLRFELGDATASPADALACYRLALADGGLSDGLADDARHNLARARLLALQYVPPPRQGPDQPKDEGDRKPETKRDDQKKDEKMQPGGEGDGGKPGTRLDVRPAPGDRKDATPTDEGPPPGAGLPAIPDTAEATPLSAQDAAEHLKNAARRVEEERQAHRLGKARTATPGVRDW
jgi:hypothetical protein